MIKKTIQNRQSPTLFALLTAAFALFAFVALGQPAAANPAVYDCSSSSLTNTADCQALVELYQSSDGDNWTDNGSWMSGSPCDSTSPWFGVTCTGNRVTVISLAGNGLNGTLPESVLNLDELTFLFLSDNQLGGAVPEVTNLASPLIGLYLNQNSFEGEIPVSLSNLGALEFLYLNGNKLDGAVPSELCALKPISAAVGTINLGYNALDNSTPASDLCIDAADSQWRTTQTVAPDPHLHTVVSLADDGSLTVAWTPIEFASGAGFYEVFVATTSGSYGATAAARTSTKSDNRVAVTGLDTSQEYFFVVRTQSNASEFNPNIVVSGFSDEISSEPVALTLADFQAVGGSPDMLLPAALVLLLALLSLGVFVTVSRRAG